MTRECHEYVEVVYVSSGVVRNVLGGEDAWLCEIVYTKVWMFICWDMSEVCKKKKHIIFPISIVSLLTLFSFAEEVSFIMFFLELLKLSCLVIFGSYWNVYWT